MTEEVLAPWWMSRAFDSRADEFTLRYAERSGIPVDLLRSWGRFAEPCHCQAHMCEGWQMGHQWEDAIVEDAIRRAKARLTQ